MTKQEGNVTQRTPQAKKQSDQASRQISKQASGSANAPYDLVFTAMGPPLGHPAKTATITSEVGRSRSGVLLSPPSQGCQGRIHRAAPPPPSKTRVPELGADKPHTGIGGRELNWRRVIFRILKTTRLWSPLMQEETKIEIKQEPTGRLTTVRRTIVSPPLRKGKGAERDKTIDLQYSVESERKFRVAHVALVQAGLDKGNPQVQKSSSSESRYAAAQVAAEEYAVSSEDSSDNEDAETGYWKSKNKYREDEDEDISRPWRRQKVDAFTRRISDFSEDKKRRMPANVKTYDGTGDPDDHLKIFESAATIENWPQPVWWHMFNSTLVGNAQNWFSKLPHRSIDGFEELRRAFRLNFTQRKKCGKNPVELARVKQRQGESTSAYVECYKDECIHVKACPKILKISRFMNGINNPDTLHFFLQK
ncbi:reverse transcriptase domain-containing protein [Tanacetum coccineum]|uniref:Reverse transcriptase domain-containing protein n=1 Tax=Tanacetum coccineum TaxID=301880 RepID=A0ABQ5FGA5_9ASTR